MKYTAHTATLAALLSLLVQLILPFVTVHPSSAGQNSTASSSLFGGKILICTVNGLKWINVTDIEKPIKETPGNSTPGCPLCILHQQKTITNTTAIPVETIRYITYTLITYPPQHTQYSEEHDFYSQIARAPPLSKA